MKEYKGRRREHEHSGRAGWLAVAILFGLFAAAAIGSAAWELTITHELGGFGLGSILTGAAQTELLLGAIFIVIVIAASYEYLEG